MSDVVDADSEAVYRNLKSVLSADALYVVVVLLERLFDPGYSGGGFDLSPVSEVLGRMAFERSISELVVLGYMDRSERGQVHFNFERVFDAAPFCEAAKAEARRVVAEARASFNRRWREHYSRLN